MDIRVNGVAPGPVWTPLIPATMPEKKVREVGGNTVFGRPSQAAELAPLYAFLASQDATAVSGKIYGATGGRTPFYIPETQACRKRDLGSDDIDCAIMRRLRARPGFSSQRRSRAMCDPLLPACGRSTSRGAKP